MRVRLSVIISVLFLVMVAGLYSIPKQAEAAGKILNVVGLYSETAAGSVSYRVGGGNWVVIKVGDQIPNNAEIRVNVD